MDQNPNPEEKKDEKLEFLKREEIRTMQKDLSRLREEESQRERERIAALKEGEKKPSAPAMPAEEGKPEEKKEAEITLIPRVPKRPAPAKKILIRGLIIVAVFLIVGTSIWFLFFSKEDVPEITLFPEEKVEEVEEPVVEEEEIFIPPALISVNTTSTLEISSSEELTAALSQLLGNTFETDSFTRVLIEDTSENKILGLKELFKVFEIQTPQGLLSKFGDDFTLFIYSAQENRLGFITRVLNKEGLADLMILWENTMEKDAENLFNALGKEGPASVPYFRTAYYQERVFRYISFPPVNFGTCWAIMDDYFLFTSSGESMIKLINLITK